MAARRAKDEVLNYLRVLEHIDAYQNGGRVSEEHILALHHDITQSTLDDPATEGAFPEGPGRSREPAHKGSRVFPLSMQSPGVTDMNFMPMSLMKGCSSFAEEWECQKYLDDHITTPHMQAHFAKCAEWMAAPT